jgi:two-component system, OmpR family, response regulator
MPNCMRRVLVIEDDCQTASELGSCLGAAGYDVTIASDGEKGLRLVRAAEYAVMTVDRVLPGIDGIEVIRRLRQDGIGTPALVISALGHVADRVEGLHAGADDYLVKPFAFSEMLARVDALSRRSTSVRQETVLRVGDLEMDLVARTASRAGRQIGLRPREFSLLEYLARHTGEVITRRLLLQHVWGLHFDPETNLVDVYVGRLRRKIDSEQAYPIIRTVRGVGFCVRAAA